jgi:hypothetical protein
MTVIKRIVILEGRFPPPRPSGSPLDLACLTPAERRETEAILAGVGPDGDLAALTDDDLHRLKTLWIMAGAR